LYSQGRVINALEGVYLLSSCLHLLSWKKKIFGEKKKIFGEKKKNSLSDSPPGPDNPE
jgi:hypothetical protein